MKKSEILFSLCRILSDGLMIFCSLVLIYFVRMVWFDHFGLDMPQTVYSFQLFVAWALKITLFLLAVLGIDGRYQLGADEKIVDELFHVLWALSAGMALILVFFFFQKFTFFSRFIFGGAWVAAVSFVFLGRMGLRAIRWSLRNYGIGRRKVLVLGTGKIAAEVLLFLKDSVNFEIVGLLLEEGKSGEKLFQGAKVLGNFSNFEKVLTDHNIEEVLLVTENPSEKITAELVEIAHIKNVKFHLVPDELGLDLADVEVSTLNNWPVLMLHNTRMQGWRFVLKSIFDCIAATMIVILISPILFVITFRIWVSNRKAPILYRSKRVGKDGHIFDCLKFRTMVPEADQMKKKLIAKNERKGGVFFKLEEDPRITPFGSFLRQWSLDELPQLFNVMKGEMSLIGPRPHLPEEVEKYKTSDRRVLSIKPGITGFSQIKGRSSLSYEQEMKYELFYLKNWSLWLDLVIFVKSVWVVLRKENAS